MLEIFVLIAILTTLIPGVDFFIKLRKHRNANKEWRVRDEEVNKWRHSGNAEKLNEAVENRMTVINKIFKFQNHMERATYFLAAGACMFAIIEAYKLILKLTGHNT